MQDYGAERPPFTWLSFVNRRQQKLISRSFGSRRRPLNHLKKENTVKQTCSRDAEKHDLIWETIKGGLAAVGSAASALRQDSAFGLTRTALWPAMRVMRSSSGTPT